MDIESASGIIQEGLFTGLDYISLAIMGLIIAFTIVCVILFLIYVKSFKHKIRIKEITNGRKLIKDDFYKEIKKKDGTIWYRLFKSRVDIPTMPTEAIEQDSKGRKILEVYKLETGEFIPIVDKNHTIPDNILKIDDKSKRQEEINKYLKENKNVICSLDPLTTEQRITIVDQCFKANSKTTKTMSETILQIAPLVLMAMIIICAFAFWGELGKPVVEINKDKTTQLQLQKEIVTQLVELKKEVQTLQAEDKTGVKINAEAPN